MSKDPVNPDYYFSPDGQYEITKVILAYGLSFALGNVFKYAVRAGKKGDRLLDLQKMKRYIELEIEQEEKQRLGAGLGFRPPTPEQAKALGLLPDGDGVLVWGETADGVGG